MILIEHKIDIKSYFLHIDSTMTTPNKEYKKKLKGLDFKININWRDGTFSIIKNKGHWTESSYKYFPFIGINNEYNFDGLNNPIHIIEKLNYNDKLFLHRSLFKNIKFKDIRNINFGEKVKKYLRANVETLQQATIFPEILETSKKIRINVDEDLLMNFSDILEFKAKDLDLTFKHSEKYVPNLPVRRKIDHKIKMSKIKIQFERFSQFQPSQKIATIFYKSVENKDPYADLKISNGILKTSFGNLNIKFQKSNNIKIGDFQKIGFLVIDDFIRYNEKTKKFKVELGQGAFRGMLIPPSFVGEFNSKLKISFNEAFKNMEINIFQEILKPYLNLYNGKVRLKIKSENFFNFKKISKTISIKKLFKIIIYFKENDIPFDFLERKSIEVDEIYK